MTGLDLDALEAVARAATPGPWHQGAHYIGAGGEPHDPEVQVGQASAIRDAKHMAAFDPPTVLAMIARMKWAESQLAEEIRKKRVAGSYRDDALTRLREAEAVIARIEQLCAETDVETDEATQAWLVESISTILASYKTTNDENGEGR